MSNIFLDEIMRRKEQGRSSEFRELLRSNDLQTLALIAIAVELHRSNKNFESVLRSIGYGETAIDIYDVGKTRR